MIKGLVVSCQAVEGEILHDFAIMDLFALAAQAGGADGIRASGIRDIRAIKQRVDLPIIGLIKEHYEDSDIYITPTLKEVKELCEEGVDYLALDATFRPRPHGEKLQDLVAYVKQNYPNIRLMADTARLEEALAAEKMGFDCVSTTLCGYTPETKGIAIPDMKTVDAYLKNVKCQVIVEGGIWEASQVKEVLAHGAETVVIGTAITRPMEITQHFKKCFTEKKKGDSV
jgi:N-acylglucosamine-6-phosphate 2-epimerase